MRAPFFPHPCQHWLLSFFVIYATLNSVRLYLIVVLLQISPMINYVWYFFIHLVAILSSLRSFSLSSLSIFMRFFPITFYNCFMFCLLTLCQMSGKQTCTSVCVLSFIIWGGYLFIFW